MFVGICDGFDPAFHTQKKFSADVDISPGGTHRISRNKYTFDNLVRILLDNFPVFKRSRFSLIGVDRNNLRKLAVLGHKSPFDPGRKTCTAAAAQPGLFYLLDDLLGFHCQRFPDRQIAAVIKVGRYPFGSRAVDIPGQNRLKSGAGR